MKKVTLIIDGKEIEAQVNDEDLKVLYIKNGRAAVGDDYYSFDAFLEARRVVEKNDCFDNIYYDSGNYFLTEKECKDEARVVSLWLKMKRFADEHNERNIDFTKKNEVKYFLGFDYRSKTIVVDLVLSLKGAFQIYFDSKQTAKKAIDEFHDDLMWYFTEYGKES